MAAEGFSSFFGSRPEHSPTEQFKLLFTQKESAVALAVSLRTVQHLIESGALPVKRIGRRVLIHRKDLERFALGDHPSMGGRS
ncbi:MAG: helix-turn-helix domain-containing protein [Acidobacteriia bacterium]|nr:helix-turn-helix domain-containing protein [Terriglobia bacterium]